MDSLEGKALRKRDGQLVHSSRAAVEDSLKPANSPLDMCKNTTTNDPKVLVFIMYNSYGNLFALGKEDKSTSYD